MMHLAMAPRLLYLLFFLSVTVAVKARAAGDSVVVLPLKYAVPVDAEKLGSIRAGNNATATECDYEALIASAKDKARAMGGNLVKITQLVSPAFISKCYKIEADVYRVPQLADYGAAKAGTALLSDTEKHPFALLCIYRLPDTLALEAGYNIHLDKDSVICRVKSKSRDSVRIYREGPLKLWAETEQRTELKLNAAFGAVYYVRCGLGKGEIRMIPVLELIDTEKGAEEFGKGSRKKKNGDVKYLFQVH